MDLIEYWRRTSGKVIYEMNTERWIRNGFTRQKCEIVLDLWYWRALRFILITWTHSELCSHQKGNRRHIKFCIRATKTIKWLNKFYSRSIGDLQILFFFFFFKNDERTYLLLNYAALEQTNWTGYDGTLFILTPKKKSQKFISNQ